MAIDQTGSWSRWSLDGGIAGLGLRPATQLVDSRLLAARRMGRIVTENGSLKAVYGRWWPHVGNMLQILWDLHIGSRKRDRCELFFHEPFSAPGFITLSYVHAGPYTSVGTVYAATLVLDEIARIKRSNAIVCNVTNPRITDRVLKRWGWERHCLSWSSRHFIKRLYGEYSEIPVHWRRKINLDP